MSDDLNNPGPEDGKLISLTEDHELDYWTSKLGVTREQLRQAVAEIGNSAAKVTEYFKNPFPSDEGDVL